MSTSLAPRQKHFVRSLQASADAMIAACTFWSSSRTPRARFILLELLDRIGAVTAVAPDTAAAFEPISRDGAQAPYDVVIYAESSHSGRESLFAQKVKDGSADGRPRLIKLVPMSTLAELDIHSVPGVHAWLPKAVTEFGLHDALAEALIDEGDLEGSAVDTGFGRLAALNRLVLLAEDNAVNAEIATALLHDLGCTVVNADDGDQPCGTSVKDASIGLHGRRIRTFRRGRVGGRPRQERIARCRAAACCRDPPPVRRRRATGATARRNAQTASGRC
jgi:hypothetical protein